MGVAGAFVESYPCRDGAMARRYWVHERVLVGGAIRDTADAERLRTWGVTHLMSAQNEHGDDDIGWPAPRRLRMSFPDYGQSLDPLIPGLVGMIRFAQVAIDDGGTLYTHCRLGGSRGPALGYMVLRTSFGMPPVDALNWVRSTREADWLPHKAYIESIERAIDAWRELYWA